VLGYPSLFHVKSPIGTRIEFQPKIDSPQNGYVSLFAILEPI